LTTTAYDAAGRMVAQQDARGYVTTVGYDANGQRTEVLDANAHAWTTAYDARGSVLLEIDPLGNLHTYAYDPVGNRSLRVDGRGWPTTYAYDNLNREIGRTYIDGTLNTFTFDAAGQRTVMQDTIGVTSYAYDRAGRQTSVVNAYGQVLTYSYDAYGNRTVLLDSEGRLTTYIYDAQERLASIVNPWNETTTYTYDALNRELMKALANGVVCSHVYDAAGRETARQWIAGSGAPVALYTATYDAVGNRMTVQELDGSLSQYTYDASNQLLTESRTTTYPYSVTYTYDGAGNRMSMNDNGAFYTYAYDPANAQVLRTRSFWPTVTTTYDANGNMVWDSANEPFGPPMTIVWDPENRFTVGGSTPYTMTYNADGYRQQQVNQFGPSFYLWDEQNVLQKAAPTPTSSNEHYTNFPGYWGGAVSQRSGNTSSFYVFDLSGNLRAALDATGAVTDTLGYRAFGIQFGRTGSTFLQFTYGGQYGYLDNGGTLQAYATLMRELSGTKGIWLSRDPIGFDGGDWNPYRYVFNSPLTEVDPSGLSCGKLNVYYWVGGHNGVSNYWQIDWWIKYSMFKVNLTSRYQAQRIENATALHAANTDRDVAGIYMFSHGGCPRHSDRCDALQANNGFFYAFGSRYRGFRPHPNSWVRFTQAQQRQLVSLWVDHCPSPSTSLHLRRTYSYATHLPFTKISTCQTDKKNLCDSGDTPAYIRQFTSKFA
jgi:RHS repeat-associated protein